MVVVVAASQLSTARPTRWSSPDENGIHFNPESFIGHHGFSSCFSALLVVAARFFLFRRT
jgi:hypothetical protein